MNKTFTISRNIIITLNREQKIFNIADKISDVSAGKEHSIVLTQDGCIIVIEENDAIIQLEDNRPKDNNYPQIYKIDLYKDLHFVAISAGWYHSLALTRDGQIIWWGINQQHNCPKGNNFIAISAGHTHSLALTKDGRIVGWGSNYNYNPSGDNFVAISAGNGFSLALTKDGRVVGWHSYDRFDCPTESNFVAVAADSHCVALTRDGKFFEWGLNDYQIDCTTETKFVAIETRWIYSYGLTNDGHIITIRGTDRCQNVALPYDFLRRLNSGLRALCNMPKYIKMEVLEDYTDWTFGQLYYF